MTANERWARNLIRLTDPHCRPRWEVFDSLISDFSQTHKRCLNIGSGVKEEFDMAGIFSFAADTDILFPQKPGNRMTPFYQADLLHLPFRDHSFDLILLRFVVEHLADPQAAFQEIARILSPGGKVLIITTNVISPFILLPKLLMPYAVRKWLLKKLFHAEEDDIFPTYHRINSKAALKKRASIFSLQQIIYIQDINWTRRWLFIFFYAFHLKTKFFHLECLRSNIIAILHKS